MEKYDVIVIGSGPGGYNAAIKTAQAGHRTVIIEKESLGGVCLNVGCIPSKSLLKNADVARLLSKDAKTYGVSYTDLKLDYSAAVERSRKVSKRLNQGVAFLMKQNAIDVIYGAASFTSANSLLVKHEDGSTRELESAHIIIAAGTHPVVIPGMEPDGERILDYRQAILQTTCPHSIVIIGGGAIGVELATVWNAYGSDVTIVEMKEHLLPNEDVEAGLELEKSFKKQGIKVRAGTALSRVEKTADGVLVHLNSEKGESEIVAQQILIAVGFSPNTADLALDNAGVALHPRGWIITDEYCSTNVPGLFAIGDITGKILLAHAASEMAEIVAAVINENTVRPFDAMLIPHATYSHPQVASFGLTEEMARSREIPINIRKASFIANGKALGINENGGWVKLISDRETDQILGAVMVGAEVCELLPELTLAAANRWSVVDIAMNVHAHPTLSEVIMEAAQQPPQ